MWEISRKKSSKKWERKWCDIMRSSRINYYASIFIYYIDIDFWFSKQYIYKYIKFFLLRYIYKYIYINLTKSNAIDIYKIFHNFFHKCQNDLF